MMKAIPLPTTPRPGILFALGFRPFFLAAGVWAVLALAVWIGMLSGRIPFEHYYGGTLWHAHEMLFGYAGAVIAGFLLTATRNWTGMETPSGAALASLAGLWLAARIAPFLPLPDALVAALNLAFFPALALGLYRALWHGPNPTNRVFLALFAVMTLAALLVELQTLGILAATAPRGIRLMLDAILLTLLLVAGRVMPFFTERAIAGAHPRVRPLVERLTFGLAAAGLIADLLLPGTALAGSIALLLAAVQAVRLAGWHDPRVWRIPILAVLYSGYLWLILGFALDGLAGLGLVPAQPALHALTAGAIGVLTLGMMSRVILGHTGREMRSSVPTIIAYVLLNAAALVRVGATLILPAGYMTWVLVSGLLWTLAFVLFLWVYLPMLIGPRVDGRPG